MILQHLSYIHCRRVMHQNSVVDGARNTLCTRPCNQYCQCFPKKQNIKVIGDRCSAPFTTSRCSAMRNSREDNQGSMSKVWNYKNYLDMFGVSVAAENQEHLSHKKKSRQDGNQFLPSDTNGFTSLRCLNTRIAQFNLF